MAPSTEAALALVVWRPGAASGAPSATWLKKVEALQRRGVGFRSLQEAIDTTSPSGKLVFHLFGALSEFERDLVRERPRWRAWPRHGRGAGREAVRGRWTSRR